MPNSTSRRAPGLLKRGLLAPHPRQWLFLLLMAAYLALQFLLLERGQSPVMVLVPGAMLAALALMHYNTRVFWMLGLALMPVSLHLEDTQAAGFVIPSDFLAILLLFVLVAKARAVRGALARASLHPIFWAIVAWLAWMLVTVVPSSMPVISLKFWLNTVWYVSGFFLFTLVVLWQNPKWAVWWWWAVAPLLAVVLLYTLANHASEGFSFLGSYHAMSPFYKEHTAYAASIAIFVVGYAAVGLGQRKGSARWALAWGMAGLVLIAVVASYTRGAWLGVMFAVGLWALAKWWRVLRYGFFILVALVGFAMLALSQQEISEDAANAEERGLMHHFRTAFDTKENISNKERVNRWVAALGMVNQRPVFGFGPGTFAFQYAPFQKASHRTYISTNRGDVGTAHNEFLLATSEMGWVGGGLFLALMLISMYYGMRGYRRARAPWRRTAYAAAFAGLVTFYVHSIVNNFLDQDKVAIPIFVCLAVIVALDKLHPELPAPTVPGPIA